MYATVFEPVFGSIASKYPHTGDFSVGATCDACEAATAAHLGESVDALRRAVRPTLARRGQGDALAARTGARDTALTAGTLASIQRAMAPAPETDDLLARIQAFAQVAGLGDCVEAAPISSAGFRLSSGQEQGELEPARRRSWWLLARISGQVDMQALTPPALDPDFISWLANPADASSRAFWELLTFLRQAGGLGGRYGRPDSGMEQTVLDERA